MIVDLRASPIRGRRYAGISPPDDDSVLETDLAAWQRVQDVNLTGVFLCCKHGIPHLLAPAAGRWSTRPPSR